MSDHTRRLAEMGMHATHVKDALLCAVLQETADLSSRNHWTLREKLTRLRTLAETIRDTGGPMVEAHPTHGISSFEGLRGDDETQPARGEGDED